MAEPRVYNHQTLTLKCLINSNELQKTINIRLPTTKDWNRNLQSLLTRIPKKFKSLANIHKSEWQLCINSTIIDKNDPKLFGELLSSIPPIPLLEIVRQKVSGDFYVITVHYDDKEFDYKMYDGTDKWDNDTYMNLIKAIRKQFHLNCQFGLYEDVGGSPEGIDDIDDILGGITDNNNNTNNELLAERMNSLHIFVKMKYQLTVVHGNKSFLWVPPNPKDDYEETWDCNYNSLIKTICNKYQFNANNIQLQQNQNGIQFYIECGDDLMVLWNGLKENNNSQSTEIQIISENKFDEFEEGQQDTGNTTRYQCESYLRDTFKTWWIECVGLPQYLEIFIEEGYEDLTYLDDQITEQELIDIGIQKRPHRKKILREITKYLQTKNETENGDVESDAHEESLPANQLQPQIGIKDNDFDVGKHYKLINPLQNSDDDEIKENESVNQPKQMKQMENSIKTQLVNLGTIISKYDDKKKIDTFKLMRDILNKARSDAINSARHFQMLLGEDQKTYCVSTTLEFLKLLDYDVQDSADGILLTGCPNQSILQQVASSLHDLSNAIQRPMPNIYEQLKLTIPENSSIKSHESGINDNDFIIFKLQEWIKEDQQGQLIDKTILEPVYLERFINFLVPNTSRYECKEIYFKKLEKLRICPIGCFGSREEVLNMLTKYKAISKTLFNALRSDIADKYLKPGIHTILPINLPCQSNVLYLFYWSAATSFDKETMNDVTKMKKDPACLLRYILMQFISIKI